MRTAPMPPPGRRPSPLSCLPPAIRPAALALAATLAGCGAQPAPTPAPSPTRAAVAAPEQRLDSGLRWVVEQSPGAPTVAAQLWLPAGAMHDPAEHPGAAALSASTAGLRLDRALTPLGGEARGWARVDASVVSMTVAPEHLEAALDALRRVMTTPPAEAEIEAARAAHGGQIITAARQPERVMLRRLLGLAWGDHPGARPLLGVEAPPSEATAAWRAAFHRPAGAALVIAGDVPPTRARAAVRAALDGWTGAPPAHRWTPPSPPAKGPVVQIDPRAAGDTRIRIGWPIAVNTPARMAAADVLASALVFGPDAPIPAALRRAGLTARSRAFAYAPGPDGLLVLAVDLPAGGVDRAWKALAEALRHISRQPPSRGRIARIVDALDGARDRAGADPMALAADTGPRVLRWPGARGAWHEALGAVDPATVGALAATLRPRVMTAALATPVPEGIDPGLWGEQLAEAFSAEPLPAGLAAGLPGVEAQVIRRPGSGVVTLHVRVPAGTATVPPDMLGAAELAARALAAPLPGLGRPTVRLEPESLAVALTVPTARFPEAAGAIFDRLLRPRWTGEQVEIARVDARARRRTTEPAELARRVLVADLARVAGASTAEPEAVDAGLETVPPARVAAWFDGFVTHGPLRVTAIGDLDEAALDRALAAGVPTHRPLIPMRPLRPAPSDAAGVHRAARRLDGDRAAWAVGWMAADLPDDQLAAAEVALSMVIRALGAGPVEAQMLVETTRDAARLGLVLSGPAAAVRAEVPRVFAALAQRSQVAADPDEITAAIRWRSGRQAVALSDAARLAGWIAAQADAGRAFVGPRALNQWQAALERARGAEALAAARDHLPLGGRFEVWVGPGPAPATPEPPPVLQPPDGPPAGSPEAPEPTAALTAKPDQEIRP